MVDKLEVWTNCDVEGLFGYFKRVKFTNVRNVRTGFAGTAKHREQMIPGFAGELAQGTNVPAELVELFLRRLWSVVKDVSTSACFAPLARGIFLQEMRPHCGVWVEAETAIKRPKVSAAMGSREVWSPSPVPVAPTAVDHAQERPAKMQKTVSNLAASTLLQCDPKHA